MSIQPEELEVIAAPAGKVGNGIYADIVSRNQHPDVPMEAGLPRFVVAALKEGWRWAGGPMNSFWWDALAFDSWKAAASSDHAITYPTAEQLCYDQGIDIPDPFPHAAWNTQPRAGRLANIRFGDLAAYTDWQAALQIAKDVFGEVFPVDLVPHVLSVADRNLSISVHDGDRLIGAYFLSNLPIQPLGEDRHLIFDGPRPAELKAICGEGLCLHPEYRGLGIGSYLRAVPSQFPAIDYVWGQQLRKLGNLKDWMKRREIVILGPLANTTAEIVSERARPYLEAFEDACNGRPLQPAPRRVVGHEADAGPSLN